MTRPQPNVVTLATDYRAALGRLELAAARRLVSAYGAIAGRLDDLIAALTEQIGAMEEPTRAAVLRIDRYRRLLSQIESELSKFSGAAEIEMVQTARAAIALAGQHALGLVEAYGVRANWNRLNAAAVETLLGFLKPDGPLFARLAELAPRTAALVGEKLLEGVALGRGPRQLAAEITKSLGVGLTDSLRMTRTVVNYSYRESTRANYAANSDVVSQWQWFAELDSDVCLACAAEHGNIYPLDTIQNSHHNCRCTMLPVIQGESAAIQSGEAWFNSLPESQQRDMMGPGRYEAWQAGKFEFSQLVRERDDDVYGPMKSETPLKELVGE